MTAPDCRTIDANGNPFGPMLAKMLHEAEESVVDHPDFNERCRLSSLIAQAAAFIDAVNEGATTSAASADLAAAVRAYKTATDAREDRHYDEDQSAEARAEFVRLCNAETDGYRAMLAALARLDAAGGA